MLTIYTIVNITPWGSYTVPSFFTDRQEALNYLHELQSTFPNEQYKLKIGVDNNPFMCYN